MKLKFDLRIACIVLELDSIIVQSRLKLKIEFNDYTNVNSFPDAQGDSAAVMF